MSYAAAGVEGFLFSSGWYPLCSHVVPTNNMVVTFTQKIKLDVQKQILPPIHNKCHVKRIQNNYYDFNFSI